MTAFHIPGIRCPCGSADLVIGCPGTWPVKHALAGTLDTGERSRAWCSVEHAQADGWPWLHSENSKKTVRRRS